MPKSTQQTGFEKWVDETFLSLLAEAPEVAELMGVYPDCQQKRSGDTLTDFSLQAILSRYDMMDAALEKLKTTDEAALSDDDLITYQCFEEFLRFSIFDGLPGVERRRFIYNDYPVNQEFGRQLELPIFMTTLHVISDVTSAENYVSRLHCIGRAIDEIIIQLKANEDLGVVAPVTTLTQSIEGINDFLSSSVQENPLFIALKDALDGLVDLDKDRRDNLLERTERVLREEILPGYTELLQSVEIQLDKAPEECGLALTPNGLDYYDHLLRSFTTIDMSASELHELGQQEVKRLQQELIAELAELGFCDVSLQTGLEKVFDECEYYLEDTEANRSLLIAESNKLISVTEDWLPTIFSTIPAAKVCVVPHPKYVEKTRTHRYNPPGAEGKRKGTFELNLAQQLREPIFSLPTLVYHEVVPGHHWQLSIAQEAGSLGVFRRTYVATAYIEGWAKYAELLPWEFGLNRDPRWGIHRKQRELVSTVNLIIDTGIHSLRWSREKAMLFFCENTGMSKEFSQRIVDRLIAYPAQSCSYKIGLIKIMELRKNLQTSLGSAFNIKVFHNELLRHGSLPLEVLGKVVQSNMLQAENCNER